MRFTQEKIDYIRTTAKQCAIVFGVLTVLLFVACKILMTYWEDAEWYPMVAHMCIFMGNAMLFFCIVSIVVMFIIDQKKKDDKNKRRIDELENTVHELQSKKDQARNGSPLVNLTDEQQTAIENFLLELPPHITKVDNAINMKEWARFIKALEELNYISPAKSADLRGLREWVVLLADGRSVPNSSAFNQALRDATPANIDNAVETIKKLLKSDKI